jgi:hypothetical protein
MNHATLVASISKHDIGGIVAIAIAVVLVVLGGMRLAVKAVAMTFFVVAVVVAVIAVLLFTRVI